eukprot:COSAG02_NODE_34807_length_478_cov_0.654354_1_plen_44_part_01
MNVADIAQFFLLRSCRIESGPAGAEIFTLPARAGPAIGVSFIPH